MDKGRFISFEGLDGAGKTTQIVLLSHWLEQQHIPHVRTREPGGTPLGNEIRSLLFAHPELQMDPLAEAFLFQADRAQHFSTVILPSLAAGKLVITDRCYDSSIAYQGAAQGVGAELVTHLSALAIRGRAPDLTLLLDLEPAQVQQRTDMVLDQSGLRGQQTRFDQETLAFQQRLRQAFLTLAQQHPERIKIVDASLSPQQIHQAIITLVKPLL